MTGEIKSIRDELLGTYAKLFEETGLLESVTKLASLNVSFTQALQSKLDIQRSAIASILKPIQENGAFAQALKSISLHASQNSGLHDLFKRSDSLMAGSKLARESLGQSQAFASMVKQAGTQLEFPHLNTIIASQLRLKETANSLFVSSKFQDLFRSFKPRFLQRNLTEALETLTLEELNDFVQKEAIAIYAVPRASIVVRLVRAPNTAARRKILNVKYWHIVDDCHKALQSERLNELIPETSFARGAIAAMRDGHHEAAQALLTVTLDSLITRLIDDKKERARITKRDQQAEPPIDIDNEQFAKVVTWLPIWNAHETFYAWNGDKIPRNYSRHATVHAVKTRQYSKRNCIQALLLVTSLIKYGATHRETDWGIIGATK